MCKRKWFVSTGEVIEHIQVLFWVNLSVNDKVKNITWRWKTMLDKEKSKYLYSFVHMRRTSKVWRVWNSAGFSFDGFYKHIRITIRSYLQFRWIVLAFNSGDKSSLKISEHNERLNKIDPLWIFLFFLQIIELKKYTHYKEFYVS